MIELATASVSICVAWRPPCARYLRSTKWMGNAVVFRVLSVAKDQWRSNISPFSESAGWYYVNLHVSTFSISGKRLSQKCYRYGWLPVRPTTVHACRSQVILKKSFKTFPCSMPGWRENQAILMTHHCPFNLCCNKATSCRSCHILNFQVLVTDMVKIVMLYLPVYIIENDLCFSLSSTSTWLQKSLNKNNLRSTFFVRIPLQRSLFE